MYTLKKGLARGAEVYLKFERAVKKGWRPLDSQLTTKYRV